MRGKDDRSEILFSYIRLDERIPANHPLQVIRQLVDAALAELSRAFNSTASSRILLPDWNNNAQPTDVYRKPSTKPPRKGDDSCP